MRTNYVLIDYENVQPEVLPGLDADHFKVLLFVGANQAKLSFDIVAAMQKPGARAEYIKMAGNGSNALDFHIAFYIGHLAAQDPAGLFHIISKDTGFDPWVKHLKSKKVSVVRSKTIEDHRRHPLAEGGQLEVDPGEGRGCGPESEAARCGEASHAKDVVQPSTPRSA